MSTYRTFPTEQAARDYRHAFGTGGWIFVPDQREGVHYTAAECVLFPPELTPSCIFKHPFTAGRDGRLIGAQ